MMDLRYLLLLTANLQPREVILYVKLHKVSFLKNNGIYIIRNSFKICIFKKLLSEVSEQNISIHKSIIKICSYNITSLYMSI